MVIFSSAFLDTNMGVWTSMNPLFALMGGAEMEEGPGDGDGGPRG